MKFVIPDHSVLIVALWEEKRQCIYYNMDSPSVECTLSFFFHRGDIIWLHRLDWTLLPLH